ncbi:hypothetical protein ACFFF5_21805 [Lederbergia wuyishanensis]|uniref:DNA-directed RNA polymerase subunit F n=1 Tax=Lederbergia wuyishanensis TaxID=1347903 RepID=A0ABU0DAZ7_9BACI|nr:hypothetical protein [Lederbergia wuyishanensis]MCJ8010078.1 hypothetical protein [Lederbergia wuyishanensis]MDQ0345592.1 DNA-directed RNA polymerase subunit F [Lederbergia wuyishanensis]
MTIINKLATHLNRRDEERNIELAHELVNTNNLEGIKEVIQNLSNKDKKIQQDCIKVAYEIGEMKPELISEYALIFIDFLKSRNNRLVWGSMTALSTIALVSADMIMEHIETLFSAMKTGSVITMDKGVLTLAKLAAVNKQNNERIFPFLLSHLRTCRPKEIPQHTESTILAVTGDNKEELLSVLRKRENQLTTSQLKRIKKVYKVLED